MYFYKAYNIKFYEAFSVKKILIEVSGQFSYKERRGGLIKWINKKKSTVFKIDNLFMIMIEFSNWLISLFEHVLVWDASYIFIFTICSSMCLF